MTKKEKTEITVKKVINSAIEMFGEKGYEGFSINEFCRKYDFSKGKLYHNFSGKDEIYIETVKYCFSEMINYLENAGEIADVQTYIKIRMKFFLENRAYEKIFFEVMTKPPINLLEEISEIQAELWNFNRKIFSNMISKIKLRKDITIDDVLDYFELMQEIFNRRFSMMLKDMTDSEIASKEIAIKMYREKAEKFLDCILYGIIENNRENYRIIEN